MNNSEAFRAAVRACAKVILGNDTSPYEPALEILGFASGGHPVDDGDEADTGLVSVFGELTDWAELRPEEADQAEALMVTAAREWLAVESDQGAEARYFNRWQYDILGCERRSTHSDRS
ncbi:hypothetical protein [Streptomyces werraensis]|uniref:hypothetical protein n=1 Tax=Streptomyces werraensis TaxID=68284 RepID=UPI0037D87C74